MQLSSCLCVMLMRIGTATTVVSQVSGHGCLNIHCDYGPAGAYPGHNFHIMFVQY